VRFNQEGELRSDNYGRIVAANSDPVEKKPLYHFQPGSLTFSLAAIGCNFHCDFCQNWQISQADAGLLTKSRHLPERPPAALVGQALQSGCRSLAYTYTEPVVFWEYALECMALAAQVGLSNIVVSNGFGSEAAWRAADGRLQAANIDLKAFDPDFYRRCGGRLEVVLDSLRQLYSQKVWLEITTLLIPGLNDDPGQLERLASFISRELSVCVPWHISAYRPAYRQQAPATGAEILLKAAAIGRQAGLKFVYLGNSALPQAGNTLCPGCGQVLLERSYFAVLKNLLSPGGLCPECGQALAGVWD
jgi:pyruvate formate lyase activating enzyme